MIKNILIYLAIPILALFVSLSPAPAKEALPEISGWINGELRMTEFDTVSGKRGLWLERSYRNSSGVPFHAVWIEGSGEKGWSPSDKAESEDDGPLGSGASYRTISIDQQGALIEYHPVTGLSLSVKAGTKGTLTLESNVANEEEIISAAQTLIRNILKGEPQ